MKRKLTLFFMVLGVFAALAVPASALATTQWIDEGVQISSFEEDFSGFVKFGWTSVPGDNFGCITHVHLDGVQSGSTAGGEETSFQMEPGTCVGEGVYTGCDLHAWTSNVPWEIGATTSQIGVAPAEEKVVSYDHEGCESAIPGDVISFSYMALEPRPNHEEIECLSVSGNGIDAYGTEIYLSGEVCADNNPLRWGWEAF